LFLLAEIEILILISCSDFFAPKLLFDRPTASRWDATHTHERWNSKKFINHPALTMELFPLNPFQGNDLVKNTRKK
jgi:hypothetical protein